MLKPVLLHFYLTEKDEDSSSSSSSSKYSSFILHFHVNLFNTLNVINLDISIKYTKYS